MKDGTKTIKSGHQFWRDENNDFHRLNNLPAIIYKNGTKGYCINGEWHRTNGQAFIYKNGTKQYYINGIKQTKPDKETLWICNKVELT